MSVKLGSYSLSATALKPVSVYWPISECISNTLLIFLYYWELRGVRCFLKKHYAVQLSLRVTLYKKQVDPQLFRKMDFNMISLFPFAMKENTELTLG